MTLTGRIGDSPKETDTPLSARGRQTIGLQDASYGSVPEEPFGSSVADAIQRFTAASPNILNSKIERYRYSTGQ